MLIQLLVGAVASVINVFAHSLVMTLVIGVSRRQAKTFKNSRWSLSMVMSGVVCVLMAAHTIEAVIWAITYSVVGAVPGDTEFLYFAFVNFATLGYGDITPVARWRLLGPITSMNGILLFGWSTAVIFEVLDRALRGSEQILD
jgi:hypothetical protein